MIESFRHRSGKNAESASIRNVLGFLGTELDEETIFGLDGSFGFMHFQNRGAEPDVTVGKSKIFPGNAFRLLGVSANRLTPPATKASGIFFSQYLDKGIPVIARVDIGYLPYWGVPEGVHFGAHFVAVVGVDNEEYLVSDICFDEIQRIDSTDFFKARASKDCYPINPDNEIHILKPAQRIPDLAKIGPVALRTTVRDYLRPATSNLGKRGLEKLKDSVSGWKSSKSGTLDLPGGEKVDALTHQLVTFGKQIQEFGTGGGLFRNMFTCYLHTLYVKTSNPNFRKASLLFANSSEHWQQMGDAMLAVNGELTETAIDNLLQDTLHRLEAIIEFESEAFNLLRRI
jgi:hypothetical protein